MLALNSKFWNQSVIVGVYFEKKTLEMNGKNSSNTVPTIKAQLQSAGFFSIHS